MWVAVALALGTFANYSRIAAPRLRLARQTSTRP